MISSIFMGPFSHETTLSLFIIAVKWLCLYVVVVYTHIYSSTLVFLAQMSFCSLHGKCIILLASNSGHNICLPLVCTTFSDLSSNLSIRLVRNVQLETLFGVKCSVPNFICQWKMVVVCQGKVWKVLGVRNGLPSRKSPLLTWLDTYK